MRSSISANSIWHISSSAALCNLYILEPDELYAFKVCAITITINASCQNTQFNCIYTALHTTVWADGNNGVGWRYWHMWTEQLRGKEHGLWINSFTRHKRLLVRWRHTVFVVDDRFLWKSVDCTVLHQALCQHAIAQHWHIILLHTIHCSLDTTTRTMDKKFINEDWLWNCNPLSLSHMEKTIESIYIGLR